MGSPPLPSSPRKSLIASVLFLSACSYQPVQYDPGMLAPTDGGAPPRSSAPPERSPLCGTACDAETSDGCCPAGCTAASDIDCNPQCGNGVLEAAEQCDPRGTCPTVCPNRGCTTFALEGSAATCSAICVETGKLTACTSDDGCCPPGCSSSEDRDCLAICDNCLLYTSPSPRDS